MLAWKQPRDKGQVPGSPFCLPSCTPGEEGTGLDALCDDDLQRISESHSHFLPLHATLGEAGKVEGDLRQWSCAGSGAEGEGRELPGTKEHLELSALTPLPLCQDQAIQQFHHIQLPG